MPVVRIEKLKTVIHITDTLNNFRASIRKGDVSRFINLMNDIRLYKLSYDWNIHDSVTTRAEFFFKQYGIKGSSNYIKNFRCMDVAIHLLVATNKIKDRKDIATLYGCKRWCKSLDKELSKLDLTTLTVLCNKIRKEYHYGKTSSSNKT